MVKIVFYNLKKLLRKLLFLEVNDLGSFVRFSIITI